MQSAAPSLAIVIVNYRTADLAIACVEALEAERRTVGSFEVFVVDGNSGDGSAEKLTARFGQTPWVTVLPLDFNGGFGWANNQAMLRLLQRDNPPEYIHLLNPDAIVEPGAISALLAIIEANPGVGAVGSQLLEPDGTLAGSAFSFPSVDQEFAHAFGLASVARLLRVKPTVVERTQPGPADWITGASVMFRSAALRQTGLFDDGFFLYFEEVELMHRMTRAGWAMWTVPASRVMHIGGAATGVASGVQAAVRPHPPYRYEARRRYFVRANGIAGLFAINLAWLGAKIIGLPFRLLRGKTDIAPPHDFSRTLRHGFWPSARDLHASIPRWDEPPGRMPAWSVKSH